MRHLSNIKVEGKITIVKRDKVTGKVIKRIEVRNSITSKIAEMIIKALTGLDSLKQIKGLRLLDENGNEIKNLSVSVETVGWNTGEKHWNTTFKATDSSTNEYTVYEAWLHTGTPPDVGEVYFIATGLSISKSANEVVDYYWEVRAYYDVEV